MICIKNATRRRQKRRPIAQYHIWKNKQAQIWKRKKQLKQHATRLFWTNAQSTEGDSEIDFQSPFKVIHYMNAFYSLKFKFSIHEWFHNLTRYRATPRHSFCWPGLLNVTLLFSSCWWAWSFPEGIYFFLAKIEPRHCLPPYCSLATRRTLRGSFSWFQSEIHDSAFFFGWFISPQIRSVIITCKSSLATSLIFYNASHSYHPSSSSHHFISTRSSEI